MNDPIWYQNLEVLFANNRLVEFVIIDEMNFDEKLNAILRFSIYASIILFAYKRDFRTLLFPVFVAGMTMYMSKFRTRDVENYNPPPKCQMPTLKNPYMNTLISDYVDNPNRPPACDINDPSVQAQVDKFMNHNQYRNANDLYDENNFNRQFNTNPVTSVTQEEYDQFVNWVYKNPNKSCKEDTRNCKVYEDVRSKRSTL
jgi:hypothetical protein